jgi:hypothetical protein
MMANPEEPCPPDRPTSNNNGACLLLACYSPVSRLPAVPGSQ